MPLGIRLGALSAANLALGVLIQWYTLIELGPGVHTDALFAGMAVPQVVLAIGAGSTMHVIVPLLATESEVRSRQDGWHLAVFTVAVFGLLAAALAVMAPAWTRITAPGLSGEGRMLLTQLTRIQLIGMVFTALAGVLWAVHRARQAFVLAEAAPLLGTALGIGVLVWGLPRYGVYVAAWVYVIRVGTHALLLLIALGRHPGLPIRVDAAREAWRRLRPLMAGTAYSRTDPIIDRMLSSLAPSGDLSLYYVGQQACTGLSQILNSALVAPMVSRLARLVPAEDWLSFALGCRRTVRRVFAIAATAFLLAVVAGTRFLRSGGVPGARSAGSTLFGVFVALGGYLVAGPPAEVVRGAFYATGETRLPVRVDAAVYTIGILLRTVGFLSWGVVGLAVATSAQSVLAVAALGIFLSRRLAHMQVRALTP